MIELFLLCGQQRLTLTFLGAASARYGKHSDPVKLRNCKCKTMQCNQLTHYMNGQKIWISVSPQVPAHL